MKVRAYKGICFSVTSKVARLQNINSTNTELKPTQVRLEVHACMHAYIFIISFISQGVLIVEYNLIN